MNRNLNPDEFDPVVRPTDKEPWAQESFTLGFDDKRRMEAIASGSSHCQGQECGALVGGSQVADPIKYMAPSGSVKSYCPACSSAARKTGMMELPSVDPALAVTAHVEDYLQKRRRGE